MEVCFNIYNIYTVYPTRFYPISKTQPNNTRTLKYSPRAQNSYQESQDSRNLEF